MKYNDIAKTFDMTTDQFSKAIGYTRQALYGGIKPSARSREAITELHNLNSAMWETELHMAERRFNQRKEAIHDFEQRIAKFGEC